ncbi:MAG TPA: fatty acid desaturase [Candidatus Baltobacteraceae bacterium]
MRSDIYAAVRSGKRNWPTFFGLGVIHIGALGALIPALFSWRSVGAAVALWYITGGLGITLSFHRMLTHRSLRMPRLLEYFFALLGTLALQGGPIDWVATHRKHHAHSDSDGDPHDTHLGMSWAHFEWLFRRNKDRPLPTDHQRWAPDLIADPYYRFLEAYAAVIQFVFGLLLLWVGGWSLVVWAIFVRLVFTYHCTWLVNSAAHASGYRTFRTTDRSTNCWWVALLSFGEGWHNNHHAFPFSARHGLRWFEFDMTWLFIRGLAILRLARNVKLPSAEMMERQRLKKAA